jgi:hypothetical protein
MDAAASDITTPAQGTTRYVVKIDKVLAFEEALSDITDTVFHDRFILGMDRPGRIWQKASVGGVLQKGTVEPRRVGIAVIDTGFHSVDDNAPWAPTKKRPGTLEAIDDCGQVLLENGDHTAESAVAKRQNEGMNYPRSAAPEFLQQAQSAEISFGYLSGQTFGASHGDRRS